MRIYRSAAGSCLLMPDMNLDNPFMLKYFQQWAIWWTEFSGQDGLRVDTYPYNEKVPMSKWCEAVMNEYPNFNIVGECWDSNIDQLAYWQGGNANRDGFDSHLRFDYGFPSPGGDQRRSLRGRAAVGSGAWSGYIQPSLTTPPIMMCPRC